jgi:hypothetical protein
MLSIRSPMEPIMSGGPPSLDRGTSWQSRALKYVPAKSISPSARSVRMIVKASSKREMRWSNGTP